MADSLFTPINDGSNELEHYGVKGMKWGHRKRAKKEKLVNKYRQKTKDAIERHDAALAELSKNKKDIQRKGSRSEAFKNMKSSEEAKKRTEVYRYTGDFNRAVNAGKIHVLDYDTTRAISQINEESTRLKSSAKAWIAVRDGLMNVDVDKVSKKDIKKFYKDPYKNPID